MVLNCRSISQRSTSAPEASYPTKYTRSHPPRALAGLWRCDDRTAAARLEYAFKTLPRAKKLALLAAPEQTAEVFPALAGYACEPVWNVTLEELLNG